MENPSVYYCLFSIPLALKSKLYTLWLDQMDAPGFKVKDGPHIAVADLPSMSSELRMAEFRVCVRTLSLPEADPNAPGCRLAFNMRVTRHYK